MIKWKVWTDGSWDWHYEEKPGGWAYLIKGTDGGTFNVSAENSYGAKNISSNHETELEAIYQALSLITKLCSFYDKVIVYSDSEWAVKCLNREQNCNSPNIIGHLEKIRELCKNLTITFVRIVGHTNVPENILVDKAAMTAMKQYIFFHNLERTR